MAASLLCACAGWAQDEITLDDVVRSAEQWAKENLDEDALNALQEVDRDKVKRVLEQIQKEFHGEYIIDLAALKDGVKLILPILESYDDTLPYALWLKTRVDYFDVAEEFRLLIPPPKPEPGKAPKPAPKPTPQREREVWVKKVAERPWPAAAKVYIAKLKPIFAAEKIPPELVWIAEVESTFDPRAKSPAGAVGLFQLMPGTARQYGLRTGLFDERVHPEQSARAAAKYLAYLHHRFKDWRLALAAYNAGEGTVERLLAGRKGATFDSIAGRLPAETQLYVPKVEAVLLRREGLKLSELKTVSK